MRIACIEQVALRMGFIDADTWRRLHEAMNSEYGRYIAQVAHAFAAWATTG